jgi:hypothetical protein
VRSPPPTYSYSRNQILLFLILLKSGQKCVGSRDLNIDPSSDFTKIGDIFDECQ